MQRMTVNNEMGKYHSTVCLKKLKKTSNDLCQDCHTPGQDLILEMVQICPCIARYNAKHYFFRINLEEKGRGHGNSDKTNIYANVNLSNKLQLTFLHLSYELPTPFQNGMLNIILYCSEKVNKCVGFLKVHVLRLYRLKQPLN
jgi:hypothetical protein